jgi:hypothetical protein
MDNWIPLVIIIIIGVWFLCNLFRSLYLFLKCRLNEPGLAAKHLRYFNKIFIGAMIPVVIAISSNQISGSIKEKEIKVKYVEIAVGILKQYPEEDTNIREWAVAVIQKYAPIPLKEKAKQELLKSVIKSSSTVEDKLNRVK